MRIAIVGVGSEILPDDSLGILVVRKIRHSLRKKKSPGRTLKIFEGGTAPENLTGAIRKFRPDHLLVIDVLRNPSSDEPVTVVPRDDIRGLSFSTHTLPLTLFVDYLESHTSCRTTVIGLNGKEPHVPDIAQQVLFLAHSL
jgi:hydrogenase 3 maturation protease